LPGPFSTFSTLLTGTQASAVVMAAGIMLSEVALVWWLRFDGNGWWRTTGYW
jgi:hypothetical protein